MPYQRYIPIGTLVNVGTVMIGSTIGLLLQQAFPESIKTIVFQAIGLITLLLGIQMSLKLPDGYLLHLVFSLIIGGVIGEWLHLDVGFQDLGNQLKSLFQVEASNFSDGLITAFLIFCVGSVTIVGAIEEGTRGNRELLMVKSLLDGITSIALAASYGVGVLFSVVPMLIFQGGITLLAKSVQSLFTGVVIDMISAVGGLLIIALGIRLLGIGEINIENLLPALLIAGLLVNIPWSLPAFLSQKQNIKG